MGTLTDTLDKYETELTADVAYHRRYRGIDAYCYHGITGLVLVCSAVVAAVSPGPDLAWIPKVLGGVTFVLVGLDRALSFSGRWQFHIQMEMAYRGLIDSLRRVQAAAPDNQARELAAFQRALALVREKEHRFPGVEQTRGTSKNPK